MRSEPLVREAEAAAPPQHVAIIMDGNRRWARSRGMPPTYGHRRGAEAVRRAVEACAKEGIRYLTLFAFSSENWRRPASEVGDLMDLLRVYLPPRAQRPVPQRRPVAGDRRPGRPARRHPRTDRRDRGAEPRQPAGHRGHGAQLRQPPRDRRDRASPGAWRRRPAGSIPPAIDEQLFASCLGTAGIPDPDLLIRTSGEQRISNFLLWQLAYTELVFLPLAWPDFSEDHLRDALREFHRRERRYGASAG